MNAGPTADGPARNIEDLFDWVSLAERAMDPIVVTPPGRRVGPAEYLDHACLSLLDAVRAGEDLWSMLWTEARRDPFGDIADATRVYRERLLAWVTERIDEYQRRGLVVAGDAEQIAVSVLLALEALLPIVRADPSAAEGAYREVRRLLLERYVKR